MTKAATSVVSSDPGLLTPDSWRVWLQAVRVFSFTASVVPILVGSALAIYDRSFSLWLCLVMVLASVACHAGANLANDYHDHRRGIDTAESLGPSKVIQQGLLSPAAVKRGMIVAFAVATLLGLVVVFATGWEILLLALASLAAAYLYTGGPKPLGYVALGEATVFLFMGPVMVGGAYYVLAERLTWPAVVASLPVGLLVAAILHANNVRDIELDRAAGKVTLATLLGRRRAAREYDLLVFGAYLATLLLVAVEPPLWPALLTLATLPIATRLARIEATATEPRDLNLVLRKTAGLHLRVGLLLTLGLLIAAAIDRLA
jgi:1,4-dihydroxy-2-naphthoate polyprenyltransferase